MSVHSPQSQAVPKGAKVCVQQRGVGVGVGGRKREVSITQE